MGRLNDPAMCRRCDTRNCRKRRHAASTTPLGRVPEHVDLTDEEEAA